MNPNNGKGSAPRKNRDDKKYADNWEKIFQKSDNSLKNQEEKSLK